MMLPLVDAGVDSVANFGLRVVQFFLSTWLQQQQVK